MDIFDLNNILEQISSNNRYYQSFIVNDKMDIGVLSLKPGQIDNQKPHSKDEVYFIVQGNGTFVIGNKEINIKKNTFYFVPKSTHHQIKENTEEVIAIYFFGGD